MEHPLFVYHGELDNFRREIDSLLHILQRLFDGFCNANEDYQHEVLSFLMEHNIRTRVLRSDNPLEPDSDDYEEETDDSDDNHSDVSENGETEFEQDTGTVTDTGFSDTDTFPIEGIFEDDDTQFCLDVGEIRASDAVRGLKFECSGCKTEYAAHEFHHFPCTHMLCKHECVRRLENPVCPFCRLDLTIDPIEIALEQSKESKKAFDEKTKQEELSFLNEFVEAFEKQDEIDTIVEMIDLSCEVNERFESERKRVPEDDIFMQTMAKWAKRVKV